MVLLAHESGTLLQLENSYDFAPDANRPFEEINVLRQGAHYGWPYCWDLDQATETWNQSGAMNCAGSQHERPVALLPPHSAPLSGLYYNGAMFPRLQGNLLIGLHGHRSTGARLIAIDVDSRGVPLIASHGMYAMYGAAGLSYTAFGLPEVMPQFDVLTPDWNLKTGVRPMGAPVGLTVASDGAIWVADDRNGTILRIAADE
jgi:glucose/arabinose dehydrogenase